MESDRLVSTLRSFRNLTTLGVKGRPTPGASPSQDPEARRRDRGRERKMYCGEDEIPEIPIQRAGESSCDKKCHLSALFWLRGQERARGEGVFECVCVCVCVCQWVCDGGIWTSAQALKRSATGQEPFLIPPAGPAREDLDLCSPPHPQQ